MLKTVVIATLRALKPCSKRFVGFVFHAFISEDCEVDMSKSDNVLYVRLSLALSVSSIKQLAKTNTFKLTNNLQGTARTAVRTKIKLPCLATHVNRNM